MELVPCLLRDGQRSTPIAACGKHQAVEQDLLERGPEDGERRCIEVEFAEHEGCFKLALQILGAAGVFVMMPVLHARRRQTTLKADEVVQ